MIGLPHETPTTPFWQEQPDAAVADLQSTPTLGTETDILIVGSGITGASIAYHLLQTPGPKLRVMMVEARQAASGATGRNGGHTKAASYRAFLDNAERFGTDEAVRIARLELGAIQAVHALGRTVACDAHPCDTLDVVYDAAQWARAKAAVAAMQRAVPPGDPVADYTLYERDDALQNLTCADLPDARLHGVVRYAAGSVSAYAFTVGVLKQCLADGLELHTHTPVTAIDKDDDDNWLATTPRGTVRARHVVLATNGYTAALLPALTHVVVPIRGQVAMLRVGSAMPPAGLDTTYSFVYANGYDYMITRPAGSRGAGHMVHGGGLTRADDRNGACEHNCTDDSALNPNVTAYLDAAPPRFFGRHWGADDARGRVCSQWTGIMGYTADGCPLVGPVPGHDGLWLCAAFQGHGMVFSWPCGRAAAEMVLGKAGKAGQADGADGLDAWFPACFRVNEARLRQKMGILGEVQDKAKL